MNDFKVSVVIPFYNAREFVTEAVESALAQPETGEVLLIEDGSPDGGEEVCRDLAGKFPLVKFLQHPDLKNHGAAASRNLGIQNASFPFVAFLDSDDFFLPNRFKKTKEIFSSFPDAQGVYEAIGAYYENDEVKALFYSLSLREITTITKEVEPENLLASLLKGGIGYFSFDGVTVRKEVFEIVGYFNEKLRMMEDTEMMFRLAAKVRLYPGSIKDPVTIRRVHDHNRITRFLEDKREAYFQSLIMWNELYIWGKQNLTPREQFYLSRRYVERLRKIDLVHGRSLREFLRSRKKMLQIAKEMPALFKDIYFWRHFIPSKQIFRKFA